jgi:hypothetical protein
MGENGVGWGDTEGMGAEEGGKRGPYKKKAKDDQTPSKRKRKDSKSGKRKKK